MTRLAGEYLRTGRGDSLAALAEQWSSGTASRARLEAAVQALTCALNDPAHAREFRERIYQWCAKGSLRGEFAQVLVRVCADVIAASHPDQALLRLYYLARRERGTTRALQALSDLATSSRRLRRRLLDRLARSHQSPPDLNIFLRACDPVPLTDSPDTPRALVEERGVQHSLTTCWHAVLAELPRATWGPRAESWLHCAALNAGHRGEVLLDLLVNAAQRCEEGRGEVFAALYASARTAERYPGNLARSRQTTELLLHKINVAQGLEPGLTISIEPEDSTLTTATKTTTVFLTLLCGLLLIIVGLTNQWPTWTWVTAAAVLLVVPTAAFRITSTRRGPVPVSFEEQITAPPVERTEHHISHVALPSLWDDYRFIFSATIRWYLV